MKQPQVRSTSTDDPLWLSLELWLYSLPGYSMPELMAQAIDAALAAGEDPSQRLLLALLRTELREREFRVAI